MYHDDITAFVVAVDIEKDLQRTTKQNSGTAPQQQHARHDVSGDNYMYNNYKNYNNNTTFIYEQLRHTELLRPVHPFAGHGTASQPLPALRNLVRRAACGI